LPLVGKCMNARFDALDGHALDTQIQRRAGIS
jgi:hypothetical protein